MREKYWFRVHKLRFGWAPYTWQGWIVVLLYLCVTVYTFILAQSQSHNFNELLLNFLPKLFALSALLIIITYLKGEPLSSGPGKKQPNES